MRAALVAFGELLDFVRHHADGVDAGAEVLPIGGQAAVRLDDATHLAGDVVLKGQAVGVGLEADQVVVAERLEQVVVRRDGGEDFRRRKRMCRKKPMRLRTPSWRQASAKGIRW